MATTTPNYNLRKPAPADTVNVETDIGANMDIIDAALAAKADEEHAHEEYATDADVTTAVSTAVTGVIDAAPGALNTLNELAAALGDDANFASSVTTALAGKSDTGHDHDADYEATGAIATHAADSTAVHGIADTALLITAATHALIDHDDLPGIEANIPIQAEAPADPELHDLWVDEDEPAPSGGGGGGAAIAYQAEAPDNPAEGDLWADSDETTPTQSGSTVLSPDNPPASAHAKDDEFSDTSLDGKWSWVNQGTATYTEGSGWGLITCPAGGSWSARCLQQTSPAGAFTMTAKMSGGTAIGANSCPVGIYVAEAATGEMVTLNTNMGTANSPINVYRANTATSWNSETASATGEMWRGGIKYFRIRRNSGTSFDFYVSHDGIGWYPVLLTHDPSAFLTVDRIGFFGGSENSKIVTAAIDWFRVTEP